MHAAVNVRDVQARSLLRILIIASPDLRQGPTSISRAYPLFGLVSYPSGVLFQPPAPSFTP